MVIPQKINNKFSKNNLISCPLCVTISYKIKQRIEYRGGKENEDGKEFEQSNR